MMRFNLRQSDENRRQHGKHVSLHVSDQQFDKVDKNGHDYRESRHQSIT